MKRFLIYCGMAAFFAFCGNPENSEGAENSAAREEASDKEGNSNPGYDPNRGEGKFTEVEVSPTLDMSMAESGQKVYGVKCSSCHKLTSERLVGPGWAGITNKFSAPWIMNFITNTDVMIDKDPQVQASLEICLVRMPNQNLSDDDARHLYEYMRQNDGVK